MKVSLSYILSGKRKVHKRVYNMLPFVLKVEEQIFTCICAFMKCLRKEWWKLVVIVGRGKGCWRSRMGGQFFIVYGALVPLDFLTIEDIIFIQEIKQENVIYLLKAEFTCLLFQEPSLITSTKIKVFRIVSLYYSVSLYFVSLYFLYVVSLYFLSATHETFKYHEFFVVRATFHIALWHREQWG